MVYNIGDLVYSNQYGNGIVIEIEYSKQYNHNKPAYYKITWFSNNRYPTTWIPPSRIKHAY